MNKITGLLVAAMSTSVGIASTQAMTVNQLNITGGSLALSVGSLQSPAANFTTTGTIVMGAYQPPPNVVDPFTAETGNFVCDSDRGVGLRSELSNFPG